MNVELAELNCKLPVPDAVAVLNVSPSCLSKTVASRSLKSSSIRTTFVWFAMSEFTSASVLTFAWFAMSVLTSASVLPDVAISVLSSASVRPTCERVRPGRASIAHRCVRNYPSNSSTRRRNTFTSACNSFSAATMCAKTVYSFSMADDVLKRAQQAALTIAATLPVRTARPAPGDRARDDVSTDCFRYFRQRHRAL